jgi:hypothetical protein
MPRSLRLKKLLEEALWVSLQNARDFDEFDDINASFTGLDSPHEGVWTLEFRSQLALRELRRPAGRDQHRDNAPVARPAEGLS